MVPGRSLPSSPLPKKTVGNTLATLYLSWVRSARTYRQRRLGALLVATIVTCFLYAGTRTEAGQPPVTYTVRSGDTLWSIVTKRYSPKEDPRPAIEEIRDLNGMKGYGIHPGQRLELPPPVGRR